MREPANVINPLAVYTAPISDGLQAFCQPVACLTCDDSRICLSISSKAKYSAAHESGLAGVHFYFSLKKQKVPLH
jgi:hypothetical protein